jgi:hypothetical protein
MLNSLTSRGDATLKLAVVAVAVSIVALSSGGCSGGGGRHAARAAATSTTKPKPGGTSTSTTKPTPAPRRTSSTVAVTPGQTIPGASSRDAISGDWTMSVRHPSYDALHQALVATSVTIAGAHGRFTVTSKTPATILGSRCAALPAGTVIATFSKTARNSYSGEYKVFDTSTCSFYSSASLIVMIPTFAHAGPAFAFYGVPQYAGVFVQA